MLVVGGAGYIGGSVTDILAERGIRFSVYDNLLYEHQYLKPVDFIHGDIRDYAELAKILPGYTHVIWLAAIVGDAASQIKPELTKAVNRDVVEWLSKNYDGRIVFASTCSVYGKNDDELNENSPLNPLSVYAQTKMEAEKFLGHKNAITFRLGTVYGISDAYSRLRMDLAVNYMTANAITKGKLSVFGGDQWRPLIHVRNVAEAMVNSLNFECAGVYNLAHANYQIRDLGREVAHITGCDVEFVEMKFEDERNYRVSTNKAMGAGLTNFHKAYPVSYGVEQIRDAIKSKRIKYAESDVYFNERYIKNLSENGKFV